MRNASNGPHARQVLLDARRRFGLDIIEMHDFIFDEEIQLTPQESAEVLVDEVIEGISCSVVREMPIEQGAVRVLVCGSSRSERGQPISGRRRVKNPPNRLRVEIDLLAPF